MAIPAAAGTLYPRYVQSPYAFAEGKVLLANRVLIGPVATAAPTAPVAQGAIPAGWVDLGSIDGSAVAIDKADPTIIDVTTGLFQVLVGQVATKDGDVTANFTMAEYEPAAWAAFTGDALTSVGTATNNSIFVGGRPLLQKAVLLVGQNAVTSTEFQHWNPKANLAWKVAVTNQFQSITVAAHFLKFTDVDDVTSLLRDFRLTIF